MIRSTRWCQGGAVISQCTAMGVHSIHAHAMELRGQGSSDYLAWTSPLGSPTYRMGQLMSSLACQDSQRQARQRNVPLHCACPCSASCRYYVVQGSCQLTQGATGHTPGIWLRPDTTAMQARGRIQA